MFDGAPVLLGAGGHLAKIGSQTIAIGAVGAVDLLHQVKVGQIGTVKHQILTAPYLGDAIERKADMLVAKEKEIQQQQRHDS